MEDYYEDDEFEAFNIETRKKLVAKRADTMPTNESGKKEMVAQARQGFMDMYSSYCAR